MTIFDYIVIGGYLAFMFLLGPIYKSFSKTAKDYFQAGGTMLWWVVGSSAFMTSFSAWAFTGGAAKAYETGSFFLILSASNVVALIFTYFLTAEKFRQMRIVTAVEGIRKRYGKTSEQVYTWLPIVFQSIFGGIWLYSVSVFMSGVFNMNMHAVILLLGAVTIVMTLMGGSWSATAGDFIQMLIVLTITVIMAFLVVGHDSIGGLSGLINKLPTKHFHWTEFSRPGIIIFFCVTLLVNQVMNMNSMLYGAARFIFVKDGQGARKAVTISIVGLLVLAPIWMIPALSSAVIFPDLGSMYPQLNNPNEAAYVAIATELLPPGMLGLLVCGIFAASLTSMNSLLNITAGPFVRNFYIQLINKNASNAKQILVGRIFMLIYGSIWIVIALMFASFKSLDLFDLILLTAASIGLPAALPLTYGMFIKRTPEWAGWTTMVVGFMVSITARITLSHEFMQSLWGQTIELNARELGDLNIAITTAAIFIVGSLWFFFTTYFYKKSPTEYKERTDDFFIEMHTPINRSLDHEPEYKGDKRQYSVLGSLCFAYGCLTLMIIAVPNETSGRLLILYTGGFVILVGIVLKLLAKRIYSPANRLTEFF